MLKKKPDVPVIKPRKRPEEMTEADDAKASRIYWRAIRHESSLRLERRARQAFAEIKGNKIIVTKEVCECGTHHKVQVKNGNGNGPSLCPIAVALRKARLEMREGKTPDRNLVTRLLEAAAIQS
jgi:hypothetical protein